MFETEKSLDRRLKKKVEEKGGWAIKLLCTHLFGLPDRLCLLPKGRVIFVEVKTTGKKAKRIQVSVHTRLKSLGFKVIILSNSSQLKPFFDE